MYGLRLQQHSANVEIRGKCGVLSLCGDQGIFSLGCHLPSTLTAEPPRPAADPLLILVLHLRLIECLHYHQNLNKREPICQWAFPSCVLTSSPTILSQEKCKLGKVAQAFNHLGDKGRQMISMSPAGLCSESLDNQSDIVKPYQRERERERRGGGRIHHALATGWCLF